MNADTMLKTATVLLFMAAAGGLLMALLRTRRTKMPDWLAMGHGFIAAAGLTLLVYVACVAGLPTLIWAAIALFCLAGVGGVYLNLRFHTRDRPLPVAIIVGHAALAAAGLALVTFGAFSAGAGA